MIIALALLTQITAENADKLQRTAELQGAKSAILCLAFSPDGRLLASGEVGKAIRLWDVEGAKPMAQLEGHISQVATLGFSADGATLYSAGYDCTVRVWDVKSGKQTAVQKADSQKNEWLQIGDMYARFNGDASLLCFGSAYWVWDTQKKTNIKHEDGLINYGSLAFGADGRTVTAVCGSEKETTKVRNFKRCDVRAGKELDAWEGTPGVMYANVAVTGDGAWVAVVATTEEDNNCTIEIWDAKAKKRTAKPGFHTNCVNGIAFTKDGSAVVSAACDKALKFWGVKAGKELASYSIANAFMGLAVSPDGTKLATGDDKGNVQLWAVK